MISFYRIEHPSGKFLYVDNDEFVKSSGLDDHNYDEFHTGIVIDISKCYYMRQFDDTLRVTWDDINRHTIQGIQDEYYDVIAEYVKNKTFHCFFNKLHSLKHWFTQHNIKSIKKAGYQLIKYSFDVNFDPLKIFICEHQAAIDIEYMDRNSTIKELVNWDAVIDKSLSERFIEKINSMTDDELYERAENAPDCGMGAVIDEWRKE